MKEKESTSSHSPKCEPTLKWIHQARGKMKVSSVAIWCMLMALILAAESAQPLWIVNSDSGKYSTFLESLREEFGRGTPKVCDRPVTNKDNDEKFVLVYLSVMDSYGRHVFIGLGFRASDAHLVGFMDSESLKFRANFFSDEYEKLSGKYKSIFPSAQILGPPLPVESSYIDLQSKAGVSRAELSVGVSNLLNASAAVHGKDFTGESENVAKFALLSIQMVVDAAKFKYIGNQVKNRGMSSSFEVGDRIVILGYNWQVISNLFHYNPLQCQPQNPLFTEEEMDLGLLMYSGLNSNPGIPLSLSSK